jgi:hypothetical protein
VHVIVMGPVDVVLALGLTLNNNVLNWKWDILPMIFVLAITGSRGDLRNSVHM